MTTIVFDQAMVHLVASALQQLENAARALQDTLEGLRPVGVPVPSQLQGFIKQVIDLKNRVIGITDRADKSGYFDEQECRLLRTALASERRQRAERVSECEQLLRNGAWVDPLRDEVSNYDQLLDGYLKPVIPHGQPRLAEYLTAFGRQAVSKPPELAPEELDPKHRILLSNSLLYSDLRAYREHCQDRRKPLAVAFADLDNFKEFNTRLTEVRVDRSVLPPILSVVEAAAYGHGRAYRYGGDEFVLLLPNAGTDVATFLLRDLKASVEALTFAGDLPPLSLSAGVWITVPDSHLTTRELIERASLAKAKAKQLGKSRIVVRLEIGSRYDEVVTPSLIE